MSGFTNRKNWLSGLLTVSLAVIPTCTITAEENSKMVDQYIIVELEPVSVSESDTAESVSETELSTEETVEVESDPDVVLFSLQEGLDKEEYSITGISANEPIIAQLLAQTADYRTMTPLPCMILFLISRQLMSRMTLAYKFQRMQISHCIRA